VLCGVDLSVAPGDVVAIAGGVGAGKTTLLLCAAGLLRPDRGAVVVESRQAAGAAGSAAYVSAVASYHPVLTLHEVVTTRSPSPREHRAALLERVGLPRDPATRVGDLSRADLPRLALARAIANDPELLLLDDLLPALGADAAMLLRAQAARGTAILFSVRHAERAAGLATRIVILRDGRLHEPRLPSLMPAPPRRGRRTAAAYVAEVASPARTVT